jgi:Protein of unknown function (DUF1571)
MLTSARLIASLISLVLILPLLLFFPSGLSAAADPGEKLRQVADSAKDATFSITFRHRVGNRLGKQQTALVKSRGDALYMRWTGNVRKGREVLIRPDFNGGKAWIKDGGPLSFSAVSLAPNDRSLAQDYRRPADYFTLKNVAADLLSWIAEGTVTSEGGGSFQIVGKDGSSYSLKLDSNGLPKSGEIKDGSGKVLETWSIANMKINSGLTDADFKWDNPDYGFPGYSPSGMFIDPQGLKSNLEKSWARVKDYSCVLYKQERIDTELQPEHRINLKFRKPLELYLNWIGGPKKGRQLLYREGGDGKMLVRESGLMGLAAVRISPDSKLAKSDTNHNVRELSIGNSIRIIHDNLVRALIAGQAEIHFRGADTLAGRRIYLVESFFPDHQANGYYAPRSLVGHDSLTGLPLKIVNYDEKGKVFERFEWRNLKINNGFADADFDPKNPDYSF